MLPKSLSALQHASGKQGRLVVAWVVGGLVALGVPILALLLGSIINCLATANTAVADPSASNVTPPETFRILPDVAAWLPETLSPLGKICCLLLVAIVVLYAIALLMLVFYRLIQSAAVEFEAALITQLRRHSKALATVRTLSAQETALTDCLDYHLPRARATLTRWWRAFPRHLIQLVACMLVALLIAPLLCLLTAIATALVVLIYRQLERFRRGGLPLIREKAAQERNELISLALHGPLLESVHDEHAVEQRFDEQLTHYERDAVRSLNTSSWKIPGIILIASTLAALFLFILSVQILKTDASLTFAGAFTFTICYLAAIVSGVKLQQALREVKSVGAAADELDQFLSLKVEKRNGDAQHSIDRVRERVEFDHVTVQDSSGRKLLENVSATFEPGMLIGVVASQRIQARATVELLMGFGRPVGGRLLFDGQLVSDLNSEDLTHCSHWVSSDGSIVTGTVKENLLQSRPDAAANLNDAIQQSQLSEPLASLPDGLATLITPGDDRLRGDTAFRIGLARAALASASIAVVEEPPGGIDQDAEQDTLAAIRNLVNDSSISVVLPQRLLTLRQCDRVLMLHDHGVADVGTHSDLLQRNELYRHLNYLRFNPYGRVGD